MDGGRFKWAQMQHKSGLMVKSRRLPFSNMSLTNTLSMTTEFSVWRMKEQMTQSGTFQVEVFWLAKSEGKFALPAWCCKLSWYLLRAIRTEVVRGLAENSPWHRIGWLYISTACYIWKGLWVVGLPWKESKESGLCDQSSADRLASG